VRQAERRQQDEQIHLGNAELDMLALGREFPIERRWNVLALEDIGHLLAREQAAPVHPGSEIGRHRHVGRGGDDVSREIAIAAADLVEQRAEAGLRRHRRLDGDRQAVRHVDFGRVQAARGAGGERHTVEESL
jgi:hypothetical protein